jgi:hypothetical protein
MAYTTINKHTDHFNTKLYTGNNSTQSITGVGFQPDFSWFKSRGTTTYHNLYDAVRGATKIIQSNTNSAEQTFSDGLTSFDSDGFSLGSRDDTNGASYSMVSWNWKANGQGSANSDGTITTTYTSANTTAGFSIVTFTGNGTSGATVGHGLGAVPHMLMVKRTDTTGSWQVYHQGAIDTSGDPWTDYMILNSTNAAQDGVNRWNDTAPTTSVFSLGNSTEVNASGGTYVAYVFSEKTGYSKFGSYVGNNNSNGTFVYTGFKPAFIIIKNTASGENWTVYDNKRASYNPSNVRIHPNLNNAESSSADLDLLSNGFKLRTTGGNCNDGTLIYMAFGQSLVGSNNVPCTAR